MVVIGKPAFPLRYWDGTDTRFSVSDAGVVYAEGLVVANPASTCSLVADTSAGGNLLRFFSGTDLAGSLRVSSSSTILTLGQGAIYGQLSVTNASGIGVTLAGVDGFSADIGEIGFSNLSTGVRTWMSAGVEGILKLYSGAGGSGIQLEEFGAAPAAPAANNVRLYAEDNGAGKTRLMAKFSSGAAQIVALQP